jgi:zinc protease
VYYVNSALEMSRTRGVYLVDFGADPANVGKARGIVIQELRAMQTTPVTEDELRQAKAVLLRRIPLSEAGMERIARDLTARATEGLALDEPTRAANRYLALTAEDVRAAFAKWIRPSDLAQITEGPAPR